jgi:hypothetical protein
MCIYKNSTALQCTLKQSNKDIYLKHTVSHGNIQYKKDS